MAKVLRKGIIFAGNGEWAVLSLRELHAKGLKIIAVLCSGNDLREEAKRLGLKVWEKDGVNAPQFIRFAKENAELIVNVSHPEIYGKEILKATRFGVINAHGGKLPRYRGRSAINWAIINGEKEVGVTVHFMDESIDSGNILEQETVAVREKENFQQVKEKSLPLYPKLVSRAVERALAGDKGKKQGGKPIYFPKRRPEDSRIDWRCSPKDVHNLVRASFNPEYYAFTECNGKRLFITKVAVARTAYNSLETGAWQRQGLVLGFEGKHALVGAGNGCVLVKKAGFAKHKIGNPSNVLRRGMRLG